MPNRDRKFPFPGLLHKCLQKLRPGHAMSRNWVSTWVAEIQLHKSSLLPSDSALARSWSHELQQGFSPGILIWGEGILTNGLNFFNFPLCIFHLFSTIRITQATPSIHCPPSILYSFLSLSPKTTTAKLNAQDRNIFQTLLFFLQVVNA